MGDAKKCPPTKPLASRQRPARKLSPRTIRTIRTRARSATRCASSRTTMVGSKLAERSFRSRRSTSRYGASTNALAKSWSISRARVSSSFQLERLGSNSHTRWPRDYPSANSPLRSLRRGRTNVAQHADTSKATLDRLPHSSSSRDRRMYRSGIMGRSDVGAVGRLGGFERNELSSERQRLHDRDHSASPCQTLGRGAERRLAVRRLRTGKSEGRLRSPRPSSSYGSRNSVARPDFVRHRYAV